MKIISLMIVYVGICLFHAGVAWCQELVLVENGQSPYRIVVAVEAGPCGSERSRTDSGAVIRLLAGTQEVEARRALT